MKPTRILEEDALRAAVKLLAVVEALADAAAPLDPEMGDCVLCGAFATGKNNLDLYLAHDVDCPWRMAKEVLSPGGSQKKET